MSQGEARNSTFFLEERESYQGSLRSLDTYAAIRASVSEAVRGMRRLVDIGAGAFVDYDTTEVGRVVAVDLFVNALPRPYAVPVNVTLKQGDALAIPETGDAFDGALMSMLLHHLAGPTVADSIAKVRRSLAEAFRVLKPGGKLVIVESCVPNWFYRFERTVFPLARAVIGRTLSHPATLQYPPALLAALISEHAPEVEVTRIPKGRWMLQFGFRYPAALTPACPYRFVAVKPAGS